MDGPTHGHVVYFIACDHYVKVGYSADVLSRLRNMQIGNPRELVLAATVGYPNEETARAAETWWRNRLIECGRQASGEWVELEYDMIGGSIRALKPWKAVRLSEIRRATNAQIIEEAIAARCGLRARLSQAEAA